mmetsp:Transcript_120852/g.188802  ORF Transcript_120852/g.188802 Transcript_120852/m.188802 type:complete len:170 (+) Transcript_120852:4870-5379(+)
MECVRIIQGRSVCFTKRYGTSVRVNQRRAAGVGFKREVSTILAEFQNAQEITRICTTFVKTVKRKSNWELVNLLKEYRKEGLLYIVIHQEIPETVSSTSLLWFQRQEVLWFQGCAGHFQGRAQDRQGRCQGCQSDHATAACTARHDEEDHKEEEEKELQRCLSTQDPSS